MPLEENKLLQIRGRPEFVRDYTQRISPRIQDDDRWRQKKSPAADLRPAPGSSDTYRIGSTDTPCWLSTLAQVVAQFQEEIPLRMVYEENQHGGTENTERKDFKWYLCVLRASVLILLRRKAGRQFHAIVGKLGAGSHLPWPGVEGPGFARGAVLGLQGDFQRADALEEKLSLLLPLLAVTQQSQ